MKMNPYYSLEANERNLRIFKPPGNVAEFGYFRSFYFYLLISVTVGTLGYYFNLQYE